MSPYMIVGALVGGAASGVLLIFALRVRDWLLVLAAAMATVGFVGALVLFGWAL